MIVIRPDEPGLIAIDFSDEPSYDLLTDGIDLQAGLFIKRTGTNLLLVEDVGRPRAVVDYIQSTLREQGREVSIERGLLDVIGKIQQEEELVAHTREREEAKSVDYKSTPSLTGLPIKRPMLPHQLKGLSHALRVCNNANFSVPGSGKTATTLCTYAVLREKAEVEMMIIIGPASSFDPWEKEFKDTFGREPKTVRLVGSASRRSGLLQNTNNVDFVLCTYQMAYRERDNIQSFLKSKKTLLVLDESHYIKNINLGPWTQTVLNLAPLASRRMILTGTPMPHSLRDLWSQFTFLWPSEAVLHDRANFEQRAQNPELTLDEIRKEIRPFFHRTKRSELGLPDAEIELIRIPNEKLPKRQKLIIRLLELKVLREAKVLGLGGTDMATLKRWRRARTIRLMQAASNPGLLASSTIELGGPDASFDGEPIHLAPLVTDYEANEIPAKAAWTVEKTKQLVSEGRKVVIWAHFVKNLELLEDLLKEFNPLVIHGGVAPYEEEDDPDFPNRERHIRDFKNRSDRPILLANPGACAESISLHTVCQDAIYFERTFNCGQFLQSMDRINRVGMPPGTHAHYYIPLMPCGIERVVQKRLEERQRALYTLLEDDLPILNGTEDDDFFDSSDNLEELFAEILAETNKDVSNHG